nr:unnamed protein product [Digitaria exilis]
MTKDLSTASGDLVPAVSKELAKRPQKQRGAANKLGSVGLGPGTATWGAQQAVSVAQHACSSSNRTPVKDFMDRLASVVIVAVALRNDAVAMTCRDGGAFRHFSAPSQIGLGFRSRGLAASVNLRRATGTRNPRWVGLPRSGSETRPGPFAPTHLGSSSVSDTSFVDNASFALDTVSLLSMTFTDDTPDVDKLGHLIQRSSAAQQKWIQKLCDCPRGP